MSTMSRWEKLRHAQLGLCLIIASATFAVLVSGPEAGATTPPPTWEQLSPATSPSARAETSMAYDPGTGQLVLFGGNVEGNVGGNDTWTWNGTTWTKLSPATSPPDRYYTSMAYDSGTGQLVLFGGQGSGGPLNDTWTWNGTTWTKLSPATSPSARDDASMAYDSGTGQLVLFGGMNGLGGNGLNDTWTWNGSTWTQQSPTTSPSVRLLAPMAYDTASGQLVLFGGVNLNDTWTWNGSTWTQLSPTTSPPDRTAASMAYDPGAGQLVLFGGDGDLGTLNDTWTWNGSTWTQQSPATSPPDRAYASMAYDPGTGQLVLFGGFDGNNNRFNDTWVYLPVTPAPTVSAVSPNSGPANGGTAITITGTGFVDGATVVIGQGNGAGTGAIAATDVKVVSSTQITAVTGGGAKAGTWSLYVITPGGTSAANLGDDFTYH